MNKAIEILNKWIEEGTKRLNLLKNRKADEFYWTKNGNNKQIDFYTIRYAESKAEHDQLEFDLAECQQALKELLPK